MSHTAFSPQQDKKPRFATPDDQTIRWLFVLWTMLLVPLTFLVYLVTREIAVLLSGTIIELTISAVIRWYFPNRRAGTPDKGVPPHSSTKPGEI